MILNRRRQRKVNSPRALATSQRLYPINFFSFLAPPSPTRLVRERLIRQRSKIETAQKQEKVEREKRRGKDTVGMYKVEISRAGWAEEVMTPDQVNEWFLFGLRPCLTWDSEN